MITIDFEKFGIDRIRDPWNYNLISEVVESIGVLETIESTGSTVKLSDIKTNSIYLVGNYHVVDFNIENINIIITLNDKVIESIVAPTISSVAISRIDRTFSIDEDNTEIDVVAIRETMNVLKDIKRRIVKKLNQLAAILRDRHTEIVFPPYIPTDITSEDISETYYIQASDRPCNMVYFDRYNPYSFLEYKGIIGLFDDSFTLTHIGIRVNGQNKVINLDEDHFLLDELNELTGINLQDYLSNQLDFYASRI